MILLNTYYTYPYIIYTVGIAIDFLSDHIDDIKKFGDGFALLVLELTRKVSRSWV